jgi:thioredoxin-like negative regulator of GroEL
VYQLTPANFQCFVHGNAIAVVHVDAPWNKKLRDLMRLKMAAAERLLHENAGFAELDSDAYGDLCRPLKIANVPTVLYFRDGEQVDLVVGASQDVYAIVSSLLSRA